MKKRDLVVKSDASELWNLRLSHANVLTIQNTIKMVQRILLNNLEQKGV